MLWLPLKCTVVHKKSTLPKHLLSSTVHHIKELLYRGFVSKILWQLEEIQGYKICISSCNNNLSTSLVCQKNVVAQTGNLLNWLLIWLYRFHDKILTIDWINMTFLWLLRDCILIYIQESSCDCLASERVKKTGKENEIPLIMCQQSAGQQT